MNIKPLIHLMVIHVVEQNGVFHSIGEQGKRVCEPDRNLKKFAGNLGITVRCAISMGRLGDRIDIIFGQCNGLRFSVEHGEKGSRPVTKVSKSPLEGRALEFFDFFVKEL